MTQSAYNRALLARNLAARWQTLCAKYLPIGSRDAFWVYSRHSHPGEPEQGWKLHVSATVLTACEVLERIGPLLLSRDIQFKAPASLLEIQRINSGVYYGYSQIGKLITIYPNSTEQAVQVADELDHLTNTMSAPAVPFDGALRNGGCIYYRYGAFKPIGVNGPVGKEARVIRDLTGELVSDPRDGDVHPNWVSNPFRQLDEPSTESPLATTYRVVRALAQRGRGGVYQAIDLSAASPRICIVKEGRSLGEIGWDGRDGSWRVRHEEHVIKALRNNGVPAPEVYSSFRVDSDYYFVTEMIEGETLNELLSRKRRRLSLTRACRLGAQVSALLSQIHAAGWTWRDCKPGNLILTRNGQLRPLDFEGACRRDSPDHAFWGTPGFTPPERRRKVTTREHEDLYALGAILYLLVTGKLPLATPLSICKLRKNVPVEVRRLIKRLLSGDRRRQPSAQAATLILQRALSQRIKLHPRQQINKAWIGTQCVERRLNLQSNDRC